MKEAQKFKKINYLPVKRWSIQQYCSQSSDKLHRTRESRSRPPRGTINLKHSKKDTKWKQKAGEEKIKKVKHIIKATSTYVDGCQRPLFRRHLKHLIWVYAEGDIIKGNWRAGRELEMQGSPAELFFMRQRIGETSRSVASNLSLLRLHLHRVDPQDLNYGKTRNLRRSIYIAV